MNCSCHELPIGIHSCFQPSCACCACGRGRIVQHTFDPWISKLVGPILAIQGSGERYWFGLCVHGSFETNQNSVAEGGGG